MFFKTAILMWNAPKMFLFALECFCGIEGIFIHPWRNRSISQIPLLTSPISHNTPLCNRDVHFCYKVVHCGILPDVLWDLCDGSTAMTASLNLRWSYNIDDQLKYIVLCSLLLTYIMYLMLLYLCEYNKTLLSIRYCFEYYNNMRVIVYSVTIWWSQTMGYS